MIRKKIQPVYTKQDLLNTIWDRLVGNACNDIEIHEMRETMELVDTGKMFIELTHDSKKYQLKLEEVK